jgi:heterodisulfide reductase subunit A-like polyferredoxin
MNMSSSSQRAGSSSSGNTHATGCGTRLEGRIAVIGAGVAGVATATALHAAGLEFVVYERQGGVGGLWFQNYPGASGTKHPSHPCILYSACVCVCVCVCVWVVVGK